MKRYLIVILLAVLILPGISAQNRATAIVALGDSAYVGKEYFRAIELYDSALRVGGPSATLYYNIGNAYYRVGQNGRAILSYERALRLDPTNRAARLNLDFVNNQTADKTVDSGNVMIQLGESIMQSMSANTWAWLSLSLFIIFLALASGYIFGSSIMLRKVCFFGGLVVLMLTICSVIFSVMATRAIHDDRDAVVIVPKAALSLSPGRTGDTQADRLVIHEGHKVEILDSITGAPGSGQGKWYEVNVGNNTRAWIEADDIERISAALL